MNIWNACKYALLLTLSACGWQKTLDPATLDQMYTTSLAPPTEPMRVFHIGHSLVNRDMPLMLEHLAGAGHEHRSQLGWGASLQSHWEPKVPINGFDTENAHARYQDARQAIESGTFDAVVLTEAVEIKDSIRYFDSPKYIRRWTSAARTANPSTRVYLYETWHSLDDPQGWLERLDADLPAFWEGVLLAQGLAHSDTAGPVYVIPAGQVLARFVREVESRGGVGEVKSREDLFSRNTDGTLDNIHLNLLGNYLVALTHYAVLYHRPPPVDPGPLAISEGVVFEPPGPVLAQLMSDVVWSVVTRYPKTGVAQQPVQGDSRRP
jgi:hypothetical protein